MKRKNVLFLVVDSLLYDKIKDDDYRHSPMPFLNKLQQEGLNSEKMYSEAPYTEAALISLLSGRDTLKNGGYLQRFKDKKTIMEVFKANGYTTFFNGFQPHIYPSCAYPGVTEKYYNVCYDFDALWAYRLYYYCELYNNNKLQKKDYELLIDIMNDNFKEWRMFFKKLKNRDKEMSFIIDSINTTDIDIEIEKLEIEYEKYFKNNEEYIKSLLTENKNHNLFKIKNYKLDRLVSKEFKKELYDLNKGLFKKVYWKNFIKNLRNNHIDLPRLFIDKNLSVNYLKMYKNALFDKDLMSKIDWNNNSIKNQPSMYSHIEHFKHWCDNREDNTPFFAYIHVDDCHSPEIFHSYDISDRDRLKYEFDLVKEHINNLPKNYKGNLAYDLSLRYIDDCIKNLYEYLEKNNLIENTYLAICADHGSSYTFTPIHENYVRNEYHENYHIPFIVVGGNIEPKNITDFHNSKDIPATIIDLAGLKVPKEFDGRTLYKNTTQDYVIIQNVNGGCPDYNRREVLIGVRTEIYAVTMSFDMNSKFEDGKLKSIYDLQKDPMEYFNLKDKNINDKVSYEYNIIKKIFEDLKKDIVQNNFLK